MIHMVFLNLTSKHFILILLLALMRLSVFRIQCTFFYYNNVVNKSVLPKCIERFKSVGKHLNINNPDLTNTDQTSHSLSNSEAL